MIPCWRIFELHFNLLGWTPYFSARVLVIANAVRQGASVKRVLSSNSFHRQKLANASGKIPLSTLWKDPWTILYEKSLDNSDHGAYIKLNSPCPDWINSMAFSYNSWSIDASNVFRNDFKLHLPKARSIFITCSKFFDTPATGQCN